MFGSMEMQRQEREVLLRSGVVGRVAVFPPADPHLAAVAYTVVDDTMVFRTSTYSVLRTYSRNAVLALEAGDVDDRSHGWTARATGGAM